ncbi:hypothetical protein ACFVXC_25810 [Streptomyces sp. NPDC058257]|uniref:hypothetical protein n=1 Tax=Streptomyces sp. NPDC058257 TaxID=3346409 RepID=UPI0036E74F5A
MNGLYTLKPWYADRLSGVRGALARREVSPDALTMAGVLCAAGAAAALAWLPVPIAALPVAVLLAARLAFANLDGALARDTGRTTRRGALLNEPRGGPRRHRTTGLAGPVGAFPGLPHPHGGPRLRGLRVPCAPAATVLRAVSGPAGRRIHDRSLIDRDGMELTGAHS